MAPPSTDEALFKTSEPSCRITLYSGSGLQNLIEIAADPGEVRTNVQQDTIYYISIDSPTPLNFTFEGELLFQPLTNNNYSDAITWTGSDHVASGDAELADYQDNEPRPSASSNSNGSNWWKWTGATTFEFDGGSFTFTIYRGDEFSLLEPITSHSSSSSELRFHAIAGETYSLQLISRSSPSFRDVLFRLTQDLQAPANDLFANAQVLSGAEVSLDISRERATREFGEPDDQEESRWYSWQAPREGLYLISFSNSSGEVYRGNSLASLTPLPPLGSQSDEAVIQAAAGESFQIALTDQRKSLITSRSPNSNDIPTTTLRTDSISE